MQPPRFQPEGCKNANPTKIENAVIPYIPESRRFIRMASKKPDRPHSSHEIHFDAALRPPLVSLREGIDADIDDISVDRTSDIIADGVAIAFDEDDAAERDDIRIHGGMPLAGESAQSGMPLSLIHI